MAHVKVIRRSMRPEEYNELRVSFLKRRVYTELCEVAPVMVRNAHQTGDVSFDFYDETPVELRRGELCYTPDGSLFFTAEADVSAYEGKELLLYYKTSSEVIVKINGRWVDGSGVRQPFNLHSGKIATDSGFADNTFTVTLPLSQFAVGKNSSADLTLLMNVNAWFSNPYLFDFKVFGGSIMQNREAQEVLRANGRDVFGVR